MKSFLTCLLLTLIFSLCGQSGWQPSAYAKEAETVTMKSCDAECKKCQQVCEETLAYCKKKGGKHAEKAHLTALEDCIQGCKLSDNFMERQSAKHVKACGFCAEVCKSCAESCDQFKDDKQMAKCAEECRKCADSCTKMSAEHHHHS